MKSCWLQRHAKMAPADWCPSGTLLKPWHSTLPALTHSHTGILLNDRGICITERTKAGGSGKYYISLLRKRCPYLETHQLKLRSLKGNNGNWRRRGDSVRPDTHFTSPPGSSSGHKSHHIINLLLVWHVLLAWECFKRTCTECFTFCYIQLIEDQIKFQFLFRFVEKKAQKTNPTWIDYNKLFVTQFCTCNQTSAIHFPV